MNEFNDPLVLVTWNSTGNACCPGAGCDMGGTNVCHIGNGESNACTHGNDSYNSCGCGRQYPPIR